MAGRSSIPSRFNERREFSACASLLNGDPATEFVLPNDLNIFASSTLAMTTADDYVMSVNGINRAPPDIDADTIFLVGRFKRGTTIQAFSGVTLYMDQGRGHYFPIGHNPPLWVPRGGLLHADFVSGNYYCNSAVCAVTDLFRALDNGFWDPSFAFDPAQVIPGTGWLPVGNAGSVLFSIPALAGWWDGTTNAVSFVAEFDLPTFAADDFATFLVSFVNDTAGAPGLGFYLNKSLDAEGSPADDISLQYDDGAGHSGNVAGTVDPAIPFKLGYTVNGTAVYCSMNGAQSISATVDAAVAAAYPSMDGPSIQMNVDNGSPILVCRNFTAYQPMSDSALDALTGS